MVSPPHLSAGNSLSSQSRDLFAEYGVSRPCSPSVSSLPESSYAASVVPEVPIIGMSESDPCPTAASISSEDSSLNHGLPLSFGPALGSNVSKIFKAAQHFSQKERDEVVFERKKNSHLMSFISAHGLSAHDVNAFVHEGKLVAHKVFDSRAPMALPSQPIPASLQPLIPPLPPASLQPPIPPLPLPLPPHPCLV